MKKIESIYIPLSFELMLSSLFGNLSMHGYASMAKKFIEWKRMQIKLMKTIKKAISINVDTDEFHRKEMLDICDIAIEKINQSQSIDEVNIKMLEYAIKMIFRLLGNMPHNSRRRNVGHQNIWKLDSYRKLTYTQTLDQKINLILKVIKSRKNTQPSCEQLLEKLWDDFKGDKSAFLNWYKETFKDDYIKIS